MKKLLFSMLAITLAAPALAAQQPVAQLSSVTASREALRMAVNTQLSAVQANFDEVYAVIDAGPVYVNASAPADTKVIWVDTDQSNAIKVYVGGAWAVVGGGGIAGDDLGSAAYSDVVALWPTCTGYLKSDGTCDTPSGSATYPSAAGVANWNGNAWGTSYTVGTATSNLVQLNASAQLPAVSGSLLTGSFTGTLLGSSTTLSGAIQTIGTELDGQDELLFDSGDFVEDTSVPGKVTVSLAAAGMTSPPTADNQLLQATGPGTYAWTSTLEGVGNITGGTYNNVTVTTPATGATLTLAEGSALATSGAYSTTLTATGTTNVTLPTSGTLIGSADLGTGVGTFLETPSSANFASAITGETGSGAAVFGTSPELSGVSYPSSTSTSTGTGNINIDGVSADHYYFNNGVSAATYTPVITSPPAPGKERAIVLTVGGGAGVITMTWTNVSFLGTTGAATTTANKYSHYGCFIRDTGNAICKIIAEAAGY